MEPILPTLLLNKNQGNQRLDSPETRAKCYWGNVAKSGKWLLIFMFMFHVKDLFLFSIKNLNHVHIGCFNVFFGGGFNLCLNIPDLLLQGGWVLMKTCCLCFIDFCCHRYVGLGRAYIEVMIASFIFVGWVFSPLLPISSLIFRRKWWLAWQVIFCGQEKCSHWGSD